MRTPQYRLRKSRNITLMELMKGMFCSMKTDDKEIYARKVANNVWNTDYYIDNKLDKVRIFSTKELSEALNSFMDENGEVMFKISMNVPRDISSIIGKK